MDSINEISRQQKGGFDRANDRILRKAVDATEYVVESVLPPHYVYDNNYFLSDGEKPSFGVEL